MGTKRTLPSKDFQKCAENLEKNNVQGLVVVGGMLLILQEIEDDLYEKVLRHLKLYFNLLSKETNSEHSESRWLFCLRQFPTMFLVNSKR